jgi:DNA-binding CsgD family transcriptional regulator
MPGDRQRAIHALWDELSDFPASRGDAALMHLKQALLPWIGADYAFWVGAVRIARGAAGRRDPQHGWRARAVAHMHRIPRHATLARKGMREQDRDPPMTSCAITAGAGTFRVRTMHDGLIDVAAFRRTSHYRIYYDALGVRDRMWVVFPVNRDAESYLVIDRMRSGRRFSAADAELAGYALRGIKWFHRQMLLSHGLPLAGTPLSAAERRVLLMLLGGRPEKEIAAALGLTPGTTHQYAVDVYRKLGVKGRTELAALWLGA